MTYQEVIALLESKRNPQRSNNFSKLNIDFGTILGIGVGEIRKLAKELKKNHELALQLWDTAIYEARLLSIFIEDARKVTSGQVDEQIQNSYGFMIADYYSMEILVKTDFIDEKIVNWTKSNNNHIKKCGFSALYAKAKLDKNAPDSFFIPYIHQVEKEILDAENWVKESMNYSLVYIGGRSGELNLLCRAVAKKIGKIKINYGDSSCITIDALNYLEKSAKKF
jgi:3-methyladenine DNA glycosylase AlkD